MSDVFLFWLSLYNMLMIDDMTDIEIKSLKNTSFDELFEAFRQALA